MTNLPDWLNAALTITILIALALLACIPPRQTSGTPDPPDSEKTPPDEPKNQK